MADQRVAGLATLKLSQTEIHQQYELPDLEARRERQRLQAQGGQAGQPPQPMPGQRMQQGPPPGAMPMQELSEHKIVRAIYSERQLQEVLTDFWFNHFNVDAQKGRDRFLLTSYERDAIRPNVLGKFRDLLGATAQSPAMLFYLDNWQSAAPQEMRRPQQPIMPRGGRGRGLQIPQPRPQQNMARGLNENYARELMELHTLGVDGGYTQKDVTEVARVFTGWTIDGPRAGARFHFEPRMHDLGVKTVLGQTIRASDIREGEQVLDLLARHPSTARFISTKLVRRFVSDEPPASLVDRAAARFRETDGDLREVMRVILTSREFRSPEAHRAKVKTPFEFVVSAVRATGVNVMETRLLVRSVADLGMPLYRCQPPTGYKDTAEAWTNTGALVNRMNFALEFASRPAVRAAMLPTLDGLLAGDVSDTTRATVARATTKEQTLALALGSPEFQRR